MTPYHPAMHRQTLLALTLLTTVAAAAEPPATFAERRKAHPTHLLKTGPAPQKWQPAAPPKGVRAVEYTSEVGALKAWFALPAKKRPGLLPAVVYFHGGFAFGADDWNDVKPFLDAGFAVMAPTLRGENGNPGNFEAFFGEVEDARAAVAWMAAQPGIDKARVYSFGHSAGGLISVLLSLYDDPQPVLTGSTGGLYGEDLFGWIEAPFNAHDEAEWRLRVLWPNLDAMKKPHVGYVGFEDQGCRRGQPDLLRALDKHKAPLEMILVPGDHFSSKPAAIRAFLARLQGRSPAKH